MEYYKLHLCKRSEKKVCSKGGCGEQAKQLVRQTKPQTGINLVIWLCQFMVTLSLSLLCDLSIGRRTREEKTERREVKVVSFAYSSSVQWNILLEWM